MSRQKHSTVHPMRLITTDWSEDDMADDIQVFTDESQDPTGGLRHPPHGTTTGQLGGEQVREVLVGGGSFGQVFRMQNGLCLKRGNWKNRLLVPTCNTIKRLNLDIIRLFPVHFPKIFACETSGDLQAHFSIGMTCIDNAVPLRDYIQTTRHPMMTCIYAQLYYITQVLNMASIFHNDFSLRNIMVGNSLQETILFEQDTLCTLLVLRAPVVYIVDLDFVRSSFTNTTDCFRVGSDQVHCTRDFDTLEVPTTVVQALDRIWSQRTTHLVSGGQVAFMFPKRLNGD